MFSHVIAQCLPWLFEYIFTLQVTITNIWLLQNQTIAHHQPYWLLTKSYHCKQSAQSVNTVYPVVGRLFSLFSALFAYSVLALALLRSFHSNCLRAFLALPDKPATEEGIGELDIISSFTNRELWIKLLTRASLQQLGQLGASKALITFDKIIECLEHESCLCRWCKQPPHHLPHLLLIYISSK